MATVQAVTTDPGETPVTARSAPTTGASNCAAVAAVQGATSGSGPAISAQSANASAPVITGRGPGTLLDLRDANGAAVLSVGQAGLGAVTATTISGTGDLTVTSGDLIANTAGNGLKVKEGSNARMGTGTLNGATEVVIATTAVTATSRIFFSFQAVGGTPLGVIYISARTPGVSFGVKGAATDASTFAWLIVEPA
jgi:hypothetical protein